MHRRKLGELEVSAIGLGCATMTPFYGEPASALATLRRALDLGVDFLDISDAHGGGRGEELVAAAIAGRRERAVIASKFGNLRRPNGTQAADGRPEYVKMACENSLRRLETEVIDLYYIHRIDRSVPIEDTVGAISDLARAGKMRFLGISEAAPATIRRAHTVHPMTTVQIEYLLLTRPVPGGPLGRGAPQRTRGRKSCRCATSWASALSPTARWGAVFRPARSPTARRSRPTTCAATCRASRPRTYRKIWV
jgi:aryl-alcohol dehydrogenase-like predicted oxidoreductase